MDSSNFNCVSAFRDLAIYKEKVVAHEKRVQKEIMDKINCDIEVCRIRDLKALVTYKSRPRNII